VLLLIIWITVTAVCKTVVPVAVTVISYCDYIVGLLSLMTMYHPVGLHDVPFKLYNFDAAFTVTVTNLMQAAYDHVKHPKFLNGEWTQGQVLKTFVDDFRYRGAYCDAVHGDAPCERISKREFVDYYMGYSTIIDRDVNFDYMMRHNWKI